MMISQMGFSKKLGQVAWSSQGGNSFLGAQMAQPADCSASTQDAIDAEVKVGGRAWWVGAVGAVGGWELSAGVAVRKVGPLTCVSCLHVPTCALYRPCTALQDIVDRAYRRAKDLVQQNIDVLHACADLLMEREQIDGEDLQVGGCGWAEGERVAGGVAGSGMGMVSGVGETGRRAGVGWQTITGAHHESTCARVCFCFCAKHGPGLYRFPAPTLF